MIYPLTAILTNDAVIFGILMAILALIFTTSHSKHPFWQKFYKFVPALLLCYFIPSLLSTFGIVHEPDSNLYFVASRYLLPACLVLLTLSIDFKGVLNLGPKAIIMFITGTFGIMIGGPLAIIIVGFFNPEIVGGVGPDEVWRGLSTVAGSWIGGGANQAAMYEVFGPSDELFGAMVTVDILVASVWLAFLLYGAGMSEKVDKWFKADASAINELRDKIEAYRENIARVPSFLDFVKLGAIAFIITALGHLGGDTIAPWIAENSPLLASFSLRFFLFLAHRHCHHRRPADLLYPISRAGRCGSFKNWQPFHLYFGDDHRHENEYCIDTGCSRIFCDRWSLDFGSHHPAVVCRLFDQSSFLFHCSGESGKYWRSSFGTDCGLCISSRSGSRGCFAGRFGLCFGNLRGLHHGIVNAGG